MLQSLLLTIRSCLPRENSTKIEINAELIVDVMGGNLQHKLTAHCKVEGTIISTCANTQTRCWRRATSSVNLTSQYVANQS